ncbi:hypothetical protein BBJ28_00019416 [Nothophytophthora sp. Chile5]|nr:hypothetical protein BBJ28_00019416 [Nothophytophthora sp. Chile5]
METARTRFRLLLAALAVGYGTIFMLCAWLVVYMRHHRHGALRGDTRAARKVLLPAFQPLLWLLTAVSFTYALAFTLLLAVWSNRGTSRVDSEVYYSGRLFVIALPVLYLRQRAVTTRALIRASLLSLLLATYNIPIVWLAAITAPPATAHYVPMVTGTLPLLILASVCLRRCERASQHTLREYAAFVALYYALRLAYSELYYMGSDVADAAFTVCLIGIFWGSLCPVVIWRVLKADTAHWRGLGRRAVHLQTLFRQKYHYQHERVSSRGLHVLIEMHRKHIIDFAYLELQNKIGAGASAVVFRGVLHSKMPVAVKVYTPRILTEETVAEFSHEAALCGALHHPNVVRFYGMCVCPPTVCLVSELCQGSLEDVTRTSARLRNQQRQSQVLEREQGGDVQDRGLQRQQLLIDLNYMIDATRAVVYLHSFSPAFLHRDLKPSNFLVDAQGTCKLTDFGESRSVPTGKNKFKAYIQTEGYSTTAATTATGEGGPSYLVVQTPTPPTPFVLPPPPMRPSMRVRGRSAMTVRGTADYMAPELIEGKAGTAVYGEAADIYSLAITLWDILHPLGAKYPEAKRSHLQVFDSVLNGERPPLSSSMHPELRRLLTEAWHQQPERRPSATYILTALETLQQEVSARTALSLAATIEQSDAPAILSGQVLMQRMLALELVESVAEACRVGNSLMSAGFLHHTHHQQPFHKTAELFYFDPDVLELYAPATPDSAFQSPASSSSADATTELLPSNSRRRPVLRSHDNHHRRRATDSPVTTRCFSPLAPKQPKRSTSHYVRAIEPSLNACACRKLGRGVVSRERGQRRHFRRNKRWLAIMEENISAEKLLPREHEFTPSLAETDDFEDFDTSGRCSDMESGLLAAVRGSEVLSIDEVNLNSGNGDGESNLSDTDGSAHVRFESGWGFSPRSSASPVVII